MMKLIIADDEHRVCQLIENILPWHDFGINLAGTAYNGVDAFHLIKEVQPDIVITDIRMPGFDGITLIEKSREQFPDISFIIVSGYRDFEYAQNALKFGAEDYLLKPVSGDELEQIILKVIEKKNRTIEKDAREIELNKELTHKREILRQQLADRIADAGCMIEKAEADSYGDRFSVSFRGSYFQIIILQIDHSESNLHIENSKAMDTILRKLESSAVPYIREHVYELLCAQRDFRLLFIMNVKNSTGLSKREIEHLHETSTQMISEYGEWKITLCPGKPVSDIELLHESYTEADFIRRGRIIRGCGKILEKKDVPDIDTEFAYFDLPELENRIKRAVESAAPADIEEIFRTGLVPAGGSPRIQNPDTITGLYRFAAECFVKQVRSIITESGPVEKLTENTELILSRSGSMERISSELSVLFCESLNAILSSKRVKDYRPIRVAKEYIEKHYSENIDLNAVAGVAELNPAYFSSLFKKETGINFKEYLLQKRMETAKELLLSGNDTIMLISEKVGYRDVRHFSKIFSRTVGIKPNMYRKIYG